MKGFEHSTDTYSEYFRGFRFNDDLDIITCTKAMSRDDIITTIFVTHNENGSQTSAVNKIVSFVNEFFGVHAKPDRDLNLNVFKDRQMFVVECNRKLPSTNEIVKETKGSNYICGFRDHANIIFHKDYEIISPNLFGKCKCNYIITVFGYEATVELLDDLEKSYNEYDSEKNIKNPDEKDLNKIYIPIDTDKLIEPDMITENMTIYKYTEKLFFRIISPIAFSRDEKAVKRIRSYEADTMYLYVYGTRYDDGTLNILIGNLNDVLGYKKLDKSEKSEKSEKSNKNEEKEKSRKIDKKNNEENKKENMEIKKHNENDKDEINVENEINDEINDESSPNSTNLSNPTNDQNNKNNQNKSVAIPDNTPSFELKCGKNYVMNCIPNIDRICDISKKGPMMITCDRYDISINPDMTNDKHTPETSILRLRIIGRRKCGDVLKFITEKYELVDLSNVELYYKQHRKDEAFSEKEWEDILRRIDTEKGNMNQINQINQINQVNQKKK